MSPGPCVRSGYDEVPTAEPSGTTGGLQRSVVQPSLGLLVVPCIISHQVHLVFRERKHSVGEPCRPALSVCFLKWMLNISRQLVPWEREGAGVNMTVNRKGLFLPTMLKFLMMTERHN